MIDLESYKAWTSPLMEGSYYEGSWEKWAKIKFLSPDGWGMTAVIAENIPYKFISIQPVSILKDGVEDTESPEAKTWQDTYENYTFSETNSVTALRVDTSTTPEYEKYMNEAWPKALETLKNMCE